MGLFAGEFVAKGTIVWAFDLGLDVIVDLRDLPDGLTTPKRFILHFGYRASEDVPIFVLCTDDARFMNHSAEPNTEEVNYLYVASRDIAEGEELTCDYGAFDRQHLQTVLQTAT
jgi:hypothetical protein